MKAFTNFYHTIRWQIIVMFKFAGVALSLTTINMNMKPFFLCVLLKSFIWIYRLILLLNDLGNDWPIAPYQFYLYKLLSNDWILVYYVHDAARIIQLSSYFIDKKMNEMNLYATTTYKWMEEAIWWT